jgi:hypothetical protein
MEQMSNEEIRRATRRSSYEMLRVDWRGKQMKALLLIYTAFWLIVAIGNAIEKR